MENIKRRKRKCKEDEKKRGERKRGKRRGKGGGEKEEKGKEKRKGGGKRGEPSVALGEEGRWGEEEEGEGL